jgi:hypothetical protein
MVTTQHHLLWPLLGNGYQSSIANWLVASIFEQQKPVQGSENMKVKNFSTMTAFLRLSRPLGISLGNLYKS